MTRMGMRVRGFERRFERARDADTPCGRLAACVRMSSAFAFANGWKGVFAVVTFALFVTIPRDVCAQVRVTHTQRGWVGMYLADRTISDSSQYPVIVSVEPGSPAQEAGLSAGDTILGFGGFDARGNFQKLQALLKPGERIQFKLRRNGTRSVTVTVAKYTEARIQITAAPEPPRQPTLVLEPMAIVQMNAMREVSPLVALQARLSLVEAELAELNRELADALRVKPDGLLVVAVEDESPARESGLRGGDVIVKADSLRVSSPDVLLRAMQSAAGRSVQLQVIRKGKTETRTLKW